MYHAKFWFKVFSSLSVALSFSGESPGQDIDCVHGW